MFTNLNLTDMETGYKVFRRDVIQSIDLLEDGFGFEPEITAKVAAMGVRIYEVGISYSGRTYSEGKKIGWADGVRALVCIARYSPLVNRVRALKRGTGSDRGPQLAAGVASSNGTVTMDDRSVGQEGHGETRLAAEQHATGHRG
jgi:hypothetical protein